MAKELEVRWEGELTGSPQDVWDGITRHAEGYLWEAEERAWGAWLDGVFAEAAAGVGGRAAAGASVREAVA